MKTNDFILFRQSTKDFVRFSDGTIFITNDECERNDEFTKEFKLGTQPICFTLDYCHFYNSFNDKVNGARIFEFSKQIGFISWNNEEEFYSELEDWGKDYIKKLKRRK